jgi:surfeit locus 1 family protein
LLHLLAGLLGPIAKKAATRYHLLVKFNFSPLTTLICLTLAFGMVCASVWQWNRHLGKQILIKRLEETLLLEPIPLTTLLSQNPDWSSLTFRRVKISGEFDFEREFLLRNRSLDGRSGFHIITPLKVDGVGTSVLIDRGFVALGKEDREQRKRYQRSKHVELYGLLKESAQPKLFAPNDPPAGPGYPWVDRWLRVHIDAIQKQIPYPLLPIYFETMSDPNDPKLPSQIVKEGSASKSDVLVLTGQQVENFGLQSPDLPYPIPTYDTTPPPDIHLGYVYEWAFMAILTLAIGVIAQLKRATSVQRPTLAKCPEDGA